MIPFRPILEELFDGSHFYNARASWTWNRWLPSRPGFLDAVTGGMLPLAGRLPVIVAAGCATPRVRALMDRAGMPLASSVHSYESREDYERTLRHLGRDRRAVFQHAPDPREAEGLDPWMPLDHLSFLNNKKNQVDLVDAANLNDRLLVAPGSLLEHSGRLPLVVKAATDESTGGGIDIRLCRDGRELEEASRVFRDCDLVLVERFLDVDRSFCVNFAISRNGAAEMIGCGEQILDASLTQQGSWVGETEPTPAMLEACRPVLERAAARGYYGVCGIDCAEVEGRIVIFDLNFRINASTTPSLIIEAWRQMTGLPLIGKLCGFSTTKSFETLAGTLATAIDERWIVPYYFFDAEAHPGVMADHRAAVVILGADRDDVLARQATLVAALAS
ncbi:MAG TPA: hypothetical protein VF701_18005 [Thermoanaerobaculia bacterium]